MVEPITVSVEVGVDEPRRESCIEVTMTCGIE
jgi:hypothetical protein